MPFNAETVITKYNHFILHLTNLQNEEVLSVPQKAKGKFPSSFQRTREFISKLKRNDKKHSFKKIQWKNLGA